MRFVKIPKKRGGYRTICCPGKRHKAFLRGLLGPLTKYSQEVAPPWVVHGFMPGRSPITNARQHVGYRYSVCFDLTDFFDTVTPSMLEGTPVEKYVKHVFINGRAWQKLPTSPVVANIAARHLDAAILAFVSSLPGYSNYTRYADDLTISFNDFVTVNLILTEVPRIVAESGFILNRDKTEVQCADHGRRHITGVGVDDKDVYPTRKMKRMLRAAVHQGNAPQANGLAEWCKCPVPNGYHDELDKAREQVSSIVNDAGDLGF